MSPKGLVHNLLIQFFTLGSSKIEVSETCFYDMVTTRYDHPSYGSVFHPFWVLGPGGRSFQGMGTQPANAAFHPAQLQN